ncbi:hypothetical protein AAHC03_0575 [Spirometra sp. Aus1]
MGLIFKFFLAFFVSANIVQCIETLKNLPEKCGRRSVRSVWKEEATYSKPQATPHSWPWLVGLWSEKRGRHPFCGGTILSSRVIVTAARCIKMLFACEEMPVGKSVNITERTDDILTVHIGDHKFTTSGPPKQTRRADMVQVHPNFQVRYENHGYDVAILLLNEPFTTAPEARPICVSRDEMVLNNGHYCFYAGWGAVLRKGSVNEWKNPRILREAEVTLTSYEECLRVSYPVQKDKTVCVETEARTPCHGDSGGGLYCLPKDEKRWFLYAVIGTGDDDCVGDRALCTSVSSVRQWISDAISKLQ